MSVLHIAFGVDESFVLPMAITIDSILHHNKGCQFVFHVFSPGISDEHRESLQSFQQDGHEVRLHNIDPAYLKQFMNLSLPKHLSVAAFIRLLIPDMLHGVTNRVLYLDADILCCGSLRGLMSLDLSNDIVAVVADCDEKQHLPRLNIQHQKYFNSGVLYINIDNWVAAEISRQVIDLRLNPDVQFVLADQDALNVVLDGRARFVDGRWNCQYALWRDVRAGKSKLTVDEDAVLLHFIGPIKPWGMAAWHESTNRYLEHHARLPWRNIDLLGYKRTARRHLRHVARALWKHKRYQESTKAYWEYFARGIIKSGS